LKVYLSVGIYLSDRKKAGKTLHANKSLGINHRKKKKKDQQTQTPTQSITTNRNPILPKPHLTEPRTGKPSLILKLGHTLRHKVEERELSRVASVLVNEARGKVGPENRLEVVLWNSSEDSFETNSLDELVWESLV
jgi:hypothetical protein